MSKPSQPVVFLCPFQRPFSTWTSVSRCFLKQRMMGIVWQLDYWSYKSCKATLKSSQPTNQHPVFLQARCPSCRPTNSVKALKGKISHSMDLLTPSSPGSLPTLSSLTSNSCWLPQGRLCHASHQPSDASTPVYIVLICYNWATN